MAMLPVRPSVIPALVYHDVPAALAWLQKAFAFEIEMIMEDETGHPVHSELRHGSGIIMVGAEWTDNHKSPSAIGRKCTQTVHIVVTDDIDGHCARAEAAGAEILARPETQFYGDRTYRARDPEGHIWTFGQTIIAMTSTEWDKAAGTRTRFE